MMMISKMKSDKILKEEKKHKVEQHQNFVKLKSQQQKNIS
jgi:hypothetical protein